MTRPRAAIYVQAAEEIVRRHIQGIIEAGVDIDWVPCETVDEIAAALPGADFLCVLDGQLTGELVTLLETTEHPPAWIQIASSGYERAEQAGLLSRYRCANAPDSNAKTVAEHAMALLLATLRNIPRMVRMQDGGRWSRSEGSIGLRSIAGAAVTILGTGHIGTELARMLRPFGVRITGVSRSGTARDETPFDALARVDALGDVLAGTDVLVVALPSTPETRSILAADVLGRLPAHAVLSNMARGNLIAADVLDAWIAASPDRRLALDVIPEEPPSDPGHWSGHPQVLISPHVAGFGAQASRNLALLMEENARRARDGQPLRNELRPA